LDEMAMVKYVDIRNGKYYPLERALQMK
jgi:hypothetical protein